MTALPEFLANAALFILGVALAISLYRSERNP